MDGRDVHGDKIMRTWKRHKSATKPPPTDTCKHFNGSLQPNFIRDAHIHTKTHMFHPPFASRHQRKAQRSLYVRIFNTNLITIGLVTFFSSYLDTGYSIFF